MNEKLSELFESISSYGNQQMSEVGLLPFFLVMLVSLTASMFIAYLYLYFYSSRATGSHIQRSFPLLGISITAIFICIQFSLPLSLGLLGALSIVRFRTPVKEPEEIGFVMLVIASSLACATLNFGFLVILLVVAVIALLARRWAPGLLEGTSHDGSLIVTVPTGVYRDKGAEMLGFLEKTLSGSTVESISRNDDQVVVSVLFKRASSRDIGTLEADLEQIAVPTHLTILFNRPGRL